MKNFIFKSADADLQKMFQSIETTQKNVLYTTHQLDRLIKLVNELKTNANLQKQVDEYFEDKPEDIPEDDKGRNSGEHFNEFG